MISIAQQPQDEQNSMLSWIRRAWSGQPQWQDEGVADVNEFYIFRWVGDHEQQHEGAQEDAHGDEEYADFDSEYEAARGARVARNTTKLWELGLPVTRINTSSNLVFGARYSCTKFKFNYRYAHAKFKFSSAVLRVLLKNY